MLIDSKYCLFKMNLLLDELNPVWQTDKAFLDLYLQINNYSLLSPNRLYCLYQYSKLANHLAGDFAQVGVLRGGSALLISLIMDKSKALYLFDTFEGLPETHSEFDLYSKGKFNNTSEDEVRELFKDSPKKVTITKGIFLASSLKGHADLNYAFVYLDVDIYTSNLDALNFFYPRLVKGGAILIDDCGWNNTPGIKKSIDDFVEKQKIPAPIITTKYQCLIQKLN